MTAIRTAFPAAAASAQRLLSEPAVAAAWERPSALAEFGVTGLAGHLASQVLRLPEMLAAPVPDDSPRSLVEHYADAAWVDVAIDDPANLDVREHGERVAADGPHALADLVAATLADVPDLLAAQPVDRVVHLPWGPWSLRLADFLLTRMLEIAVHSDDLAVSVRVDTPVLPPLVIEPVLHLLTDVAAHRHGPTAVLRTLSRAERAPDRVNAI